MIGYATAAASLGLQTVMVRPPRGIYAQKGQPKFDPLVAQAVVEEVTHDELEIVEHPVEQGSMIADHAFKRPAEVRLQYLWSNSPSSSSPQSRLQAAFAGTIGLAQLPQSVMSGSSQSQCAEIYKKLLALQTNRVLFNLFTGKRSYNNMMIKSLSVSTIVTTENMLALTMECRQILFAVTRVATVGNVPADQQLNPEATQSPVEIGDNSLIDAPPIKSAMDSITSTANTAVSGLTAGLEQGASALQSAAEAAIPQLNAAIAEATAKLPGVLESVNAQLQESIGSLQGAIAGASGSLPGIVDSAVANIQSALFSFGTPFEIPLSPTPQSFAIPLGSTP